MHITGGNGARREMTVVVALATAGVALVSLVAFAPWHPGATSVQRPVVQIHGPAPLGGAGAGEAVFVERP